LEVLTGKQKNCEEATVAVLIDCALDIEEAEGNIDDDLQFEAEIVWLWAY
jgi:hypothetical protein